MVRPLPRRTVLRGLLGGAAIAVGLPVLETMLGPHGDALAAADDCSRCAPPGARFGMWFWGNGVHAQVDSGLIKDRWTPPHVGEFGPVAATGADAELSEQLAALAPHKDRLLVLSGLDVLLPNTRPHGTGPSGLLVGANEWNDATLDQRINQAIGAGKASRQFSVEVTHESVSYGAGGEPNPSEYDVGAIFQSLFQTIPDPNAPADPRLHWRELVVDAVLADAQGLRRRLGQVDRERVDQHLESLYQLQCSVQRQQVRGCQASACVVPAAPTDLPPIDGYPQIQARSRLITDLLVMALVCDTTRVFTYQLCHPVSDLVFPTFERGFHQLTHEELGDQPTVNEIVKTIVGELAYFIQRLKETPDVAGTLLDSTTLFAFSDCSYGKSHAISNYPALIAGGDRFNLGRHLNFAGANASKLSLTLLDAFGIKPATFGVDQALASDTLSGALRSV